MADPDQIRQKVQSPAPFSTWLGVVLLLLVFGAIVIAVIGLAPRSDTYEQKRATDRAKKLKDLRDDDTKALTSYAWIDKNKGTVRVPIERAMELTVAELANKKPTAAGPIATPPTAAAPGGAAAASPAPSPSPQGSGAPKPTSVSGPNSEARGQPAAAVNPAPVQPKTQPGAASSPPGSPLPVRGASPTPTSQ